MSLPRARDPHDGVDRLPQPFRMLDKILADIIDTSLTISSKRQDTRQHFADCQFPTVPLDPAQSYCATDGAPTSLHTAAGGVIVPSSTGELSITAAPGGPVVSASTSAAAYWQPPPPAEGGCGLLLSAPADAPTTLQLRHVSLPGYTVMGGPREVQLPAPAVELQWAPDGSAALASCSGGVAVLVGVRASGAADASGASLVLLRVLPGGSGVGSAQVAWCCTPRPSRDPYKAFFATMGSTHSSTHPSSCLAGPGVGGRPEACIVGRRGSKQLQLLRLVRGQEGAAAPAAPAAAVQQANSAQPQQQQQQQALVGGRVTKVVDGSHWALPSSLCSLAASSDSRLLLVGVEGGDVLLYDGAVGCFVCALTRLLAPPASLTLLPRQGAALVVDAAGRPFYLPHPQLVPGALTTPFLGTLPAQQLKLQVQAQVQEAVALPGGQYLLLVCAAAPPQPLQLHLPGWADLQKPGASSAVCGSPASSSRAATAGQQEEAVVEEAGGAAAGSVPGIGGTAGGAAGAAGRILLLDLGLLQLVGELMPPPGSAWAGTQAGVSSSSSSSSSSSGSEGVTAGAAPLLATTQRGYLVAGVRPEQLDQHTSSEDAGAGSSSRSSGGAAAEQASPAAALPGGGAQPAGALQVVWYSLDALAEHAVSLRQEMLSAGRLSWQGQPRRQHQGLGALTEATPRLAVDLNDLVATQDTWRLASTAATLSKAGSTKQQLEAVLRKLAAEEGGFGQSVPLLKAQR